MDARRQAEQRGARRACGKRARFEELPAPSINVFNSCSAEPRAFCGDLRLFVEVSAKSRRSSANPAAALRYKTKDLSVGTSRSLTCRGCGTTFRGLACNHLFQLAG